MAWLQLVMDLGALPGDDVEALFSRFGAHAITLSDAGDEPVLEPGPGETPLWSSVRITGLFSPDADLDALRRALCAEFALDDMPAHRVEELEDRHWEREWLKDFRPMRFGSRLWVCPRGQQPEGRDRDTAIRLELDPGLAFGTGTHPTTALCLRWLDQQHDIGMLQGKRVFDFGCGSGILAIAALLLGAGHAVAMDIDPQAVTATRSNAEQNGVAANITASTVRPDTEFDLVFANILAAPLIDNAEWLCQRLRDGASLLLSGILINQVDDIRDAYGRWIDFEPPEFDDDWARLAGRKR
jgi:ribosomal protein L11 methyltransferase